MPAAPTWPGVYIEELPSGVRTITGVATSVTAFVGRARRGSVDEPVTCFSWADFERRCGGLWLDGELGYAVFQFFANGGNEAVVSRVVDAVNAAPASTMIAGSTSGNLTVRAADPGAWGNNLRVTVDHGTPGTVTATIDNDTFHLTVDEIDPEVLALTGDYGRAIVTRETFAHVSVAAGAARHVTSVLRDRSSLVRAATVPVGRPVVTVRQPLTIGLDGAASDVVDADFTAAINRLERADLVNLVCVPPLDRLTPTALSTWSTAQSWCEGHRAFLLVDPPDNWGTAQAAADLAGGFDSLRSPNVAYFYPRVLAADPLREGMARPFAPSGAVAGVFARTDATRGVWKAAAGAEATLSGVTGFDALLTDDEIGVMNRRGVNGLRSLPVSGPVVWGARTGRGADVFTSEWKYTPVRRLALFIEESLARGTRWAVFEPNDHALWAQMRLAVGSFMQDLFRQGAFAGSKPQDAYLVRCDSTTTTPADVDRGIVSVLVGFAPLSPAEFVILQFQQMAGRSGL